MATHARHSLETEFAVSAAWTVAHAASAGARILDVRDASELNGPLGRIPGSQQVSTRLLASHVARWPRDTPIIVVCRAGLRSESAVEQLEDLGFTHAVNMTGGMLAYRRIVRAPVRRTASVAA